MHFANFPCAVVMLLVLIDATLGAASLTMTNDRNDTATLQSSGTQTFALKYMPYCDEATVSVECAFMFRHLYNSRFVEGQKCATFGTKKVRAIGPTVLGGCKGYKFSVITYEE